jgi:hypothetical protein
VRNDLTEIELRFGHFDGLRQPIPSKVPAKWGGLNGRQLIEIKEIVLTMARSSSGSVNLVTQVTKVWRRLFPGRILQLTYEPMILLEFLKVLSFGSVIATQSGRCGTRLSCRSEAWRRVSIHQRRGLPAAVGRMGHSSSNCRSTRLILLILSHGQRRKTYRRERRT